MRSPIEQALVQARDAADRGEVPVGAVLVRHGEIIAADGNRIEERHDPTAHAEMLVLRSAAARLRMPRLIDCDLWVTLEPCPMCAQAISFARIRRLYYGASDPKGGGVESGPRLFDQPTCHHRPEIVAGVRENEAAALLRSFFQDRR